MAPEKSGECKEMYRKDFNIKKYRPLLEQVFDALELVFAHGKMADKALENVMKKNKKWTVYDRSFVADTFYDIIRNWRFLWTIAGKEPNSFSFGEGRGEVLKRYFLWEIFGTHLVLKEQKLPGVYLFKNVIPHKIHERKQRFKKIRSIRESVPDWLDKQGEKELGKNWNSVLSALNKAPKLILRTNTLKVTTKVLQEKLKEENVDTHTIDFVNDALELSFNRNVFRTQAFREGWFEVQDAASQVVAHYMDVKPGMRVIDACAGAGGKSLHIAALLKNKGKLLALDTKEWKLKELNKRAARAGAGVIETRLIDSSKVIKRLKNSADRLLLDVPCSGTGVLRRNPDIKWKLQPEELERLKKIQAEILDEYCTMTKIGGKMIYVTCSILPSEGEEQVAAFIKKHNEFKLLDQLRLSPDKDSYDGFYMAMMERIT